MIAGLILAAGGGARMGRPKATIEINGVRLVDHAVRLFEQAGIESIFVVLGAWVGEVKGAHIIENSDWESGMGTSLRAGLEHLAQIPEIQSVVISLVDLPGLTSEAISVIAKVPRQLVVATYKEVRGHPVKFAREHWAAIAHSAQGDVGARQYLAGRADIHYLRMDDLADGLDIDTPEDLAGFLMLHESRHQ